MSGSTGAGRTPSSAIREIARDQEGVVSRSQLLTAGVSSSAIARRAHREGWSVLHPGVYHVDTAPPSAMTRVWAAWLYADSTLWGAAAMPDETSMRPHRPRAVVAAIGGAAALWLVGLLDECPEIIEIAVPRDRHLARRSGIRILRREGLPVHPARQPPRLRVDEALLDVVHRARRAERVVGLVLAAGQRRLTTPERILAGAARRPRLRWRALVHDLCQGLQDGVHSALERHYVLRVERRHGLPRGERNVREAAPTGASWYRDVRYRGQRVVVELDGRGAHPLEGAFRDRRRDNHSARQGETTLRYGWREVVGDPCGLAAEIGYVLTLAGWTGELRPCAPNCAAEPHDRGGSLPLNANDPPQSRQPG